MALDMFGRTGSCRADRFIEWGLKHGPEFPLTENLLQRLGAEGKNVVLREKLKRLIEEVKKNKR